MRGGLDELLQLAEAPVRADVPWRHDRAQQPDAGQALHQPIRVDVIALQLGVAPDPGLPSEQLGQSDLQRAVEARDPALLAFDEGLIIDVRVADEDVVVEVHDRSIVTVAPAG